MAYWKMLKLTYTYLFWRFYIAFSVGVVEEIKLNLPKIVELWLWICQIGTAKPHSTYTISYTGKSESENRKTRHRMKSILVFSLLEK